MEVLGSKQCTANCAILCAIIVEIGDPEVCKPECLNGGYCHENTCICSGGYRGEYCQIPPSAEETTVETITVEVTTDEPPTKPMIPTPPPPPPPSPSLFITTPSSTPMPSTEPTTPPTTMTVTHTRTPKLTTKIETTKKIDPILIEDGGVTITLQLTPQEFDSEEQSRFKSTIAKNVNDFCENKENNCENTEVEVGPNDVVLYEIRGITVPKVAAIFEMQGTDTVVSMYVTHPASSSELVLNKEKLDTMLIEHADVITEELGYSFERGAADATTPPPTVIPTSIEPWAIALICVAGVVLLVIMAIGLYRNTRIDEEKEFISDVEMQEAPKMNGDGPKATLVSNEISTQASQSDIIQETKHVFVNHYTQDPTIDADEEDIDTSTQVSYQDIVKETGFDEDRREKESIDNKTTPPNITTASLEPNGNAVTVTAEVESAGVNQIPPSDRDATGEPAPSSGDDLPPAPPELDNLVKEHKIDSNKPFENPAFSSADTEIDEAGQPRTEL